LRKNRIAGSHLTCTRIEDSLRGAHMVFIAAGRYGELGGTGTGAAPIVAEIAKQQGALTVAVVSKPFSYEGQKCMDIAEEGLEELSKHVDSLIIILNEKLEEIYEDESMLDWMKHADDVLNNAVAGIAEIINVPGHINVDFNDVKTIMGEQGKAMMGTATASGVDRARIAAEQAVASPLLDGIDLSGARGVLVNVTASRGLKGKEIKEVMAAVRAFAAPDASIAQGIAYDDNMGDDIRVTVVATGLGKAKKAMQLVQQPMRMTGTHNSPMMASSGLSASAGVTMGAASAGHAAVDGMKQPAVWRREQASEQVQAMQRNGVETYDIPAFLRKQAD
jgi:cell division protein FtsZ